MVTIVALVMQIGLTAAPRETPPSQAGVAARRTGWPRPAERDRRPDGPGAHDRGGRRGRGRWSIRATAGAGERDRDRLAGA
ncbi:MAG: hypothetical protein ACYCYK_12185, partial [Candidatus Dormibacteria bacterium]